jgi:hypothetical protein
VPEKEGGREREDPSLGVRVLALEQKMAAVETNVSWIKDSLKKIEGRIWWVLGAVVALGVISIFIALIR